MAHDFKFEFEVPPLTDEQTLRAERLVRERFPEQADEFLDALGLVVTSQYVPMSPTAAVG